MTDRGCWTLTMTGSNAARPVIWPAGTRSSETRAVTLPNGQTLRVGDRVRGSGGEIALTTRAPDVDDPGNCLAAAPDGKAVALNDIRAD